ncbi:MAG: hypothetical protein JO336_18645 [Acidobacteriia bacterium]|nr:hypothetical protein [Terriglobia bacterium]
MARLACSVAALLVVAAGAWAQTPPDISGVWRPAMGGRGRGGPAAPALTLKSPYKEKYEALRARQREATARGEQFSARSSLCEPYGMPAMMQVAVYPMEIIQTPKQVTIITEAFSEVRRIYIGKSQPSLEDVDPGYYGHSVGHWEGDTLVVDTIGVKESVRGYQEMPHSNRMRISERIRRTAPGALEDQITIEDPLVLEKPVTYKLSYMFVPDYEMVEFVCENNREYVDENGIVHMKLRDK